MELEIQQPISVGKQAPFIDSLRIQTGNYLNMKSKVFINSDNIRYELFVKLCRSLEVGKKFLKYFCLSIFLVTARLNYDNGWNVESKWVLDILFSRCFPLPRECNNSNLLRDKTRQFMSQRRRFFNFVS